MCGPPITEGPTIRATHLAVPFVNRSAAGASGAPAWLGTLTSRESDVLKLIARGLSNKEIGRELNLAEITIKLHLRNDRKIGARSRSEAAVIATKANLA